MMRSDRFYTGKTKCEKNVPITTKWWYTPQIEWVAYLCSFRFILKLDPEVGSDVTLIVSEHLPTSSSIVSYIVMLPTSSSIVLYIVLLPTSSSIASCIVLLQTSSSIHSLCLWYLWQIYKHLYRCTIRNEHDILKTAVANVSKGQRDMLYKGEFQTLTKLSMRHQIYVLLRPVMRSY